MTGLTAAGIARALGGRKCGTGWVCKCVTHDDKDPSLSISQGDDGRVLLHCHASCDPRDVIAELDRRGLWPNHGHEPRQNRRTPEQRLADTLQRWQKDTADHRADADFASRVWCRGIDPGRSPAIDYLKRRRLELDDGMAGRLVRHLEDCPRGQDKAPALLVRFAPVVHPAGEVAWGEDPPVTCIQRIFLNFGKPKGHDGKWLLGHPFSLPKPFLHDGIVVTEPSEPLQVMKLTPDEEVETGLHLVEGFETGLASMMAGFRPLWATYSAQAMARFVVLPGIGALTVLADHDQAGLLAGQSCAERWVAAGREALIRWPDGLGDDYADEVRA